MLSKIHPNANDAQPHQLAWFRHCLQRCLDRIRDVGPSQCGALCHLGCRFRMLAIFIWQFIVHASVILPNVLYSWRGDTLH